MAMPNRHGVATQQVPTTASSVNLGNAAPYRSLNPTRLPPEPDQQEVMPVAAAGTLPVRVLDAFYQMLPSPSLQQLTRVVEGVWTPGLKANDRITLLSYDVPREQVFILTDVYYYAVCPSALLDGPPVQLQPYQLAGFLRFHLTLGGRTPLSMDVSTYNQYTRTVGANQQSGWPMLDTQFGTRRGGSFALYAKSSQTVLVEAVIDVLPRFTISRVGAHFHGYSIPEMTFGEVFRHMHR